MNQILGAGGPPDLSAATLSGPRGGCCDGPGPHCKYTVSQDAVAAAFGLLRRLRSGRDALAAFVRSALTPHAGCTSRPRSLFPMAPPYSWRIGVAPADAPGRTAWRLRIAADLHTNVVVLVLSFLALRGARRCPPWARSGADLSPEQVAAVAELRSRVEEYLNSDVPDSDRVYRSALLAAEVACEATLAVGAVIKRFEVGGRADSA